MQLVFVVSTGEQERTAQRAVDARRIATELAQHIGSQDPTVKCIYLFGSLNTDIPRNPDFDIDLALDGGDVLRAMELAEESAFPVDIVRLQQLPPHVVRKVTSDGTALYRRS